MRVALASRRVLANRRFFSTDDDVPVNAKLRSSGVARATIIGNVGSDPKIMKFDVRIFFFFFFFLLLFVSKDGGIAAQFSLATSNVVKRQDGSLESKTEWFLAVSRNQVVAETLEKIIKKGMMVYVEGPIECER
jgi:single-stranded DNA-binding protein